MTGLHLDYEERLYRASLDTIAMHAWEEWTNNGLGLDAEGREETSRHVHEVAHNNWREGIDDIEWLRRTLASLRGERLP
jgi:hypothetical protein